MVEPLRLHAPSRRNAVVVELPVVLAPMAGITNAAFRALCLEQGAGLYVCEMMTSRGILVGDHKTRSMLTFDSSETVRSVQLYGVDPEVVAAAARLLVTDYGVHHIDLNFGCPVPKVTRKGGGGVLPYKRDRLRAIIRAAVRAADEFGVPVTVKTRIGIDEEHETFLDTGRIAEEEGAAAIALHARTVRQAYAGQADWSRIAELKQSVGIPVLGNGDLWEAEDALRMMASTGCDGVVIGRGCLGRPWLFGDLAAAFAGQGQRARPTLGEVGAMLIRHAQRLVALMGERGVIDLRKHMAWYFKGYPVGELRRQFAMVSSLEELRDLVGQLDADQPFPVGELGTPRGRQGSPRSKVILPYGWYDDTSGRDLDLSAAEDSTSGG
ncbi:MAG: tRNA dihydrouridine synthase DusB [Propionibacteriaceae bacterium]|nr:tRNA dihydrouridine synthase DusB [Propionibacteriaceae bacterium]